MVPASKKAIRAQAHAARAAQPDKDETSRLILAQAMQLPEYQMAKWVLFYVDVRDEVRTSRAIRRALQSPKQVVIPYCVEDQLQLFHLSDWGELTPGHFGVLEPLPELREREQSLVPPSQIELVLAPGVAFDRLGRRLGHGKGFYDRLLATMPPSTTLIGLAYESQMFTHLETQPHDIAMHRVVTESRIYGDRTHFPSSGDED